MSKTIVSAVLAGFGISLSGQVLAHVEYYDLNQGAQIGDLTAAGKAVSTAHYGPTPANVVALGNNPANGLGPICTQSDLPLPNPADWNATNQSYTGNGHFSGVTYDPATGAGTATVGVDDVTSFGWYDGATSRLGDSHKVDFFNFRLATPQQVTISWNVTDGNFYYDSAFTLYRGFLSYQGHDDGAEKLNPKAATPPFPKVQDVLDRQTDAPLDVQGIASGYRNTLTNPEAYVGQFNALANWGQANSAGNWSNVAYLAHANGNNPAGGFSSAAGDTLETLSLLLPAGNYTIAASGAVDPTLFSLTNLHGELIFSASPVAAVPLPGALWLLGSTLAGLGIIGRRERAVA